ncbi:MAG: Fur family transcriptional regulator [Bacillota bacterium]
MKNDITQGLKQSGLKKTKHRTAILAILEESTRPIAAEQVYFALKEKDVSINLSTVYRILETLASKNLVAKQNIVGDGRALFEINRMVHKHYLVCVSCKKIQCIENCPLEAYEKSLEEETQYTIAGHKLDIYGYCPECKEKGYIGGIV